MSHDALERELASFKETIGLTNPLTFGHKGDWKTENVVARETRLQEAGFTATLPHKFVLTEPRNSHKSFLAAATAAKAPVQPLRPPKALGENGGLHKTPEGASPVEDPATRALAGRELPNALVAVKRVPMAKRSHMDGVLHGIPRAAEPVRTTIQDSITYSDEMQTMNRDKDTSFHRKRDAYSEYVEARARFSKMHSVN
ncbi:hypothetical protein Poli38472_006404 [Pythium oligandrum]|uniref:Uncharacterized protein n=1 Tax=Pythium oligandrum TaxID=41045 RepID=A0A8K1C4J0_PYTOL|nr:hypothetical protein Poli38472_006404 [Pythium oligandrum]|eukprot:TMW56394.1 hypothetical protein Poli38472_006404 [Pythium oligandrum]